MLRDHISSACGGKEGNGAVLNGERNEKELSDEWNVFSFQASVKHGWFVYLTGDHLGGVSLGFLSLHTSGLLIFHIFAFLLSLLLKVFFKIFLFSKALLKYEILRIFVTLVAISLSFGGR